MSFRIDDILRDKKCPIKDENANSNKRTEKTFCYPQNETKPFYQNILLERDRDKISCSKVPASYLDYQVHCTPCMESQSLEFPGDLFSSSFVACQPPKICCSRAPLQTNDKIYSSPYIYPEKIYSQSTYNHVLPLNFPIYNHYSKRRNQVRFSSSQTKALEQKFSWQKYLSPEDRKLLAYSLKLSDRQVKTWFQNRRAKWRRNVTGSTNSDVKPNISNQVI